MSLLMLAVCFVAALWAASFLAHSVVEYVERRRELKRWLTRRDGRLG